MEANTIPEAHNLGGQTTKPVQLLISPQLLKMLNAYSFKSQKVAVNGYYDLGPFT